MKYLLSLFIPFLLQAESLSFNRDVRPILSENCFYCHGVDGNKREADLRLDVREDALASDAFVPGDARGGTQRVRTRREGLVPKTEPRGERVSRVLRVPGAVFVPPRRETERRVRREL